LFDELKGDKNLFLKANWEAKTDKVIKQRIIQNRIKAMHRREQANLQARRARLANLLAEEDKNLEIEFMSKLETPE